MVQMDNIGSTHCWPALNQLFATVQRKCKVAVKGWHFHVIGFMATFHCLHICLRPSVFHLCSVFCCYLLPSFVLLNINCPSRKHNFHFKDFMSTFQQRYFFFNVRQLMQGFEIQGMVEGKILSYFEFFCCFCFNMFSVKQVVQQALNEDFLDYLD